MRARSETGEGAAGGGRQPRALTNPMRGRRTSARVFETLLRFAIAGAAAAVATIGLGSYAIACLQAGAIIPPTLEAGLVVISATCLGLFEIVLGLACLRRRDTPIAHLVGAWPQLRPMALRFAALGSAGGASARAGLEDGVVIWLLLAIAVVSVGLYVIGHAYDRISTARWLAARAPRGRTIARMHGIGLGQFAAFWLLRAVLFPAYWTLAWPIMLATRLSRMRSEPLAYACPHGECNFRSENPAMSGPAPGPAAVFLPHAFRTWPTLSEPLFVRWPLDPDDARLAPTWRGLERMEGSGFRRAHAPGCRNLCSRRYQRRFLVMGGSGPALAALALEVHRSVAARLGLSDGERRLGDLAADVAQRRWLVVREPLVQDVINGADGALVEIDFVADHEVRVSHSDYQAILILAPAGQASEDAEALVSGRLAQLGRRRQNVRFTVERATRSWLSRLLGPAAAEDPYAVPAFRPIAVVDVGVAVVQPEVRIRGLPVCGVKQLQSILTEVLS